MSSSSSRYMNKGKLGCKGKPHNTLNYEQSINCCIKMRNWIWYSRINIFFFSGGSVKFFHSWKDVFFKKSHKIFNTRNVHSNTVLTIICVLGIPDSVQSNTTNAAVLRQKADFQSNLFFFGFLAHGKHTIPPHQGILFFGLPPPRRLPFLQVQDYCYSFTLHTGNKLILSYLSCF